MPEAAFQWSLQIFKDPDLEPLFQDSCFFSKDPNPHLKFFYFWQCEIYFLLFFVYFFCCRQKTYSVKKQNWYNYFVLSQLTSPKQSHKEKKIFSTIGLIKNVKQNLWENIVQCWFYETSIEIFLIWHENSIVDLWNQ